MVAKKTVTPLPKLTRKDLESTRTRDGLATTGGAAKVLYEDLVQRGELLAVDQARGELYHLGEDEPKTLAATGDVEVGSYPTTNVLTFDKQVVPVIVGGNIVPNSFGWAEDEFYYSTSNGNLTTVTVTIYHGQVPQEAGTQGLSCLLSIRSKDIGGNAPIITGITGSDGAVVDMLPVVRHDDLAPSIGKLYRFNLKNIDSSKSDLKVTLTVKGTNVAPYAPLISRVLGVYGDVKGAMPTPTKGLYGGGEGPHPGVPTDTFVLTNPTGDVRASTSTYAENGRRLYNYDIVIARSGKAMDLVIDDIRDDFLIVKGGGDGSQKERVNLVPSSKGIAAGAGSGLGGYRRDPYVPWLGLSVTDKGFYMFGKTPQGFIVPILQHAEADGVSEQAIRAAQTRFLNIVGSASIRTSAHNVYRNVDFNNTITFGSTPPTKITHEPVTTLPSKGFAPLRGEGDAQEAILGSNAIFIPTIRADTAQPIAITRVFDEEDLEGVSLRTTMTAALYVYDRDSNFILDKMEAYNHNSKTWTTITWYVYPWTSHLMEVHGYVNPSRFGVTPALTMMVRLTFKANLPKHIWYTDMLLLTGIYSTTLAWPVQKKLTVRSAPETISLSQNEKQGYPDSNDLFFEEKDGKKINWVDMKPDWDLAESGNREAIPNVTVAEDRSPDFMKNDSSLDINVVRPSNLNAAQPTLSRLGNAGSSDIDPSIGTAYDSRRREIYWRGTTNSEGERLNTGPILIPYKRKDGTGLNKLIKDCEDQLYALTSLKQEQVTTKQNQLDIIELDHSDPASNYTRYLVETGVTYAYVKRGEGEPTSLDEVTDKARAWVDKQDLRTEAPGAIIVGCEQVYLNLSNRLGTLNSSFLGAHTSSGRLYNQSTSRLSSNLRWLIDRSKYHKIKVKTPTNDYTTDTSTRLSKLAYHSRARNLKGATTDHYIQVTQFYKTYNSNNSGYPHYQLQRTLGYLAQEDKQLDVYETETERGTKALGIAIVFNYVAKPVLDKLKDGSLTRAEHRWWPATAKVPIKITYQLRSIYTIDTGYRIYYKELD